MIVHDLTVECQISTAARQRPHELQTTCVLARDRRRCDPRDAILRGVSLGDDYRSNRRPLRGSAQRRTSHADSTL